MYMICPLCVNEIMTAEVELTKKLVKNLSLKSKVAKIIILLDEVKEITNSQESSSLEVQTSVAFISKSLIDLNYKIFDQEMDQILDS